MTWFTKWALRNKPALIFSVVAALIFGIVNYITIPMELMPSANMPFVTVSAIGNGVDASTMNTSVTKPIEQALEGLQGKQDILAQTGNNYSQLTLTFDDKTNLKDAKQQIQDALSGVNLPQNVMKPYVSVLNTAQIPVVDFTLTFNHSAANKEDTIINNDILPSLKQVKGVGNVITYGMQNQQVMIQVDPAKLATSHVSVQTLYTLLQGKNTSVAVGEQTIGKKATSVLVTGKIKSIDDIKNIQLNTTTKLQDVATVTLQKDTQSITHLNGKDAVLLIAQKDDASNEVTVGKAITDEVKKINEQYKGTVSVKVLSNQADIVQNSINSMTREVLTGALFAALVIWLFLRSFKMTLITIISIPLSLCITMILLNYFGITLNVLTLGGVAVSVGRLVDDSIVVTENIYRRKENHEITPEFIIESVKEIAVAITSSTLTTVAVFLPMGMISGSLKDFVLPFALTITFSLLSSLVVALTVVPVLGGRMMKKLKIKEQKPNRFYQKLLGWSLNHKWVPIVVTVAIVIASIGLSVSMSKGTVDQSDRSSISVTLQYKEGTTVQEMKNGLVKMEDILSKEKGVKDEIAQFNTSAQDAKFGQVQNANILSFTGLLDKGADAAIISKEIRSKKGEFKNADLTVGSGGGLGGSGGGTDLSIDISGKDDAAIKKAATQVEKKLKGVNGVQKVTDNSQDAKPTVTIQVNPEVANAQEIAQTLQAMLNVAPIGSVQINGQNITVKLAAMTTINHVSDFENLQIMTANGPTPLSKVAKVVETKQAGTLYAKNGQNYLEVKASVDPKRAVNITQAIQLDIAKWQKDKTFGKDVTVEIADSSMGMSNQLGQLVNMGLFSIGLVFMILLVTLKSFRASLAILISLPLAAIGSLLGLVVFKQSIDSSSTLGLLMLVGIVVTNAIVLVDRIRHNEVHMTIREAIVEAGSVRLRPILMTASATVFAMLPLLFSQDAASMTLVSKSLAVVVIFGLTISTLLTLIVIPTFYELFHFKKARKQRLEAEKK